MAHLGRRPRASGSVIDLSQLPSPSPSGSYHQNHSDSTLSIRMPKRRWSNFDTTPGFSIHCGYIVSGDMPYSAMMRSMSFLSCGIWRIAKLHRNSGFTES